MVSMGATFRRLSGRPIGSFSFSAPRVPVDTRPGIGRLTFMIARGTRSKRWMISPGQSSSGISNYPLLIGSRSACRAQALIRWTLSMGTR